MVTGNLTSSVQSSTSGSGGWTSSTLSDVYVSGAAYLGGAVASQTTSGGGASTTTSNSYLWWDTAEQAMITLSSGGSFVTEVLYRPGGQMWGSELDKNTSSQYSYHYDDTLGGEVAVRQTYSGSGAAVDFVYLGQQQVGDVASGVTLSSQIDYAQALDAQYHSATPGLSADFDQDYTPISPVNVGGSAGVYTVQAGDTLYSIAQQVWGDANLWYLIADANGLSPSASLSPGQVLSIPNAVAVIGHTNATSKPYNNADIIGNIQPHAPPPTAPDNGCGELGQVITAVIAVVVAYLTFGALAGPPAAIASEPIADVVAAGAIAGATGDVAGQAFSLATGEENRFNWDELGESVIGGAIGAGLGVELPGQGFGTVLERALLTNGPLRPSASPPACRNRSAPWAWRRPQWRRRRPLAPAGSCKTTRLRPKRTTS